MTNQEMKMHILNKLKNIVYALLGITVLFLSIHSIIAANGKLSSILGNIIWLILSLIILVQAGIGIKKSLIKLSKKSRITEIIDWCLILLGIILANCAYLMHNTSLIIIGIVIFIAACIPIKQK